MNALELFINDIVVIFIFLLTAKISSVIKEKGVKMKCKKCGSPHVKVEYAKRHDRPNAVHNTHHRKVICEDCGTVIVEVCDGPEGG